MQQELSIINIKNFKIMLQEMYYWMIYYLSKVKTNDMPKFNAYLLICVFLFANMGSIFVITCYLLHLDMSMVITNYKFAGLILAAIVMIPNYFYLFVKKDEICVKYKQSSLQRQQKGKIYFWIYALASIPLYFYLVVNLRC